MAKKSTKTSHVLNLIANKPDPSATTEDAAGDASVKNAVAAGETLNVDNIEITADEVSIKADEINNYESLSPERNETDVAKRNGSVIQVENKANDPVAEQIRQELEKAAASDIRQVHELEEGVRLETQIQENAQGQETSTTQADEALNQADTTNEINVADEEGMPVSAPEIHPLPLEDFDITTENFTQRPYINIVENIVRGKAIATMEKLGMCTCEKCINDVIALTLNMLPPKYVVSDTGRLYAKLSSYEKQYSANMLAAIAKACVRIQKNPRH